MLHVQTISFVSIYDLLKELGFTSAQVDMLLEYRLGPVTTWGDSSYTLIHRDVVYEAINYGFWDIHEDDDPEVVSDEQLNGELTAILTKFEKIMGDIIYVDMEN